MHMDDNDPDKIVRMQKRAARFVDHLGAEDKVRKEKLVLQINNMVSIV